METKNKIKVNEYNLKILENLKYPKEMKVIKTRGIDELINAEILVH